MSNDRKNHRNQSYAKVLLNGSFPAYIRDISPDGFRVYSPVPLPFNEGDEVLCIVIPSDGDQTSFKITGQIRWNRQDSQGDDIMGILIKSFENDEDMENYASLNKRFSESS